MDPMTIIGIVQFATSTASSLYQYIGDVKGAPDDVAELANQLDGIVIHIKELQRLLIENKTTHGWSDGGTRLAEHSISDCGIVLDKLRKLILKSGANVVSIDKTVVDSQDIQKDFFQSLLWPIIGKNRLTAIREELQRTKIDILLAQVTYREATDKGASDQEALAQKIAALWRAKQSSVQRGSEALRKSMRDPAPTSPIRKRSPMEDPDTMDATTGGGRIRAPNGHAREPSGAGRYLVDDEIERKRREVEAWDRKHRRRRSTSSSVSVILPSQDPHIDPYEGIKFVADTVVDMARSALKERAETKAKLDLLFGALENIADSTGAKLGLNSIPTSLPAILRDSHNVGGVATTHAVNLARQPGPDNKFEPMEADWSLEQLVKRLTPTKQERQRGNSASSLAIANLQCLPPSCRQWITNYLRDNKGDHWHWVLIIADPIRGDAVTPPKRSSWFGRGTKPLTITTNEAENIVGVQLVFKKCPSSPRSDHPHAEKMISNVTDLAQILVNFLWIRMKNREGHDDDSDSSSDHRVRIRSRSPSRIITPHRGRARPRPYSSSDSDGDLLGRRMARVRSEVRASTFRSSRPVGSEPVIVHDGERRFFSAPAAREDIGDDDRYGVSGDMDNDQIARRILESYTEQRPAAEPVWDVATAVVDPTTLATTPDAEKVDRAAETIVHPS